MWTRLVSRYVSLVLSVMLLSATTAMAAQGVVDAAHSVWTIASAVQTNVTLTNSNAGNAVMVVVAKNSTSNRTYTVTDDLGNSYTLVGSAGTCSSQVCV